MRLSPEKRARASSGVLRARSGHPPRRGARWLDRIQRLGVCCSAACALALLSCTPGDGFQCGTPLPGDANTIRQCDAPHQACICATNSCAEAVATTDCDTGLRYVDAPFARSDLRGKCVATPPGDWLVKAGEGNVACRDEADGGMASSSSSSSGTGGAGGAGGGSSSSSSSSSTSSGGAGGGGGGGGAASSSSGGAGKSSGAGGMSP